jgi:hypothetical protein
LPCPPATGASSHASFWLLGVVTARMGTFHI